MRKIILLAITLNTLTARGNTLSYPDSKPGETVDTLHGIRVPDPYRWMEDPDAEETKAFVKEQNEVSGPFIQECPDREKITEEITKLKDYPKLGVPVREGDNYFIRMNSGLQNQR
mgnify:CR=1 FL=1